MANFDTIKDHLSIPNTFNNDSDLHRILTDIEDNFRKMKNFKRWQGDKGDSLIPKTYHFNNLFKPGITTTEFNILSSVYLKLIQPLLQLRSNLSNIKDDRGQTRHTFWVKEYIDLRNAGRVNEANDLYGYYTNNFGTDFLPGDHIVMVFPEQSDTMIYSTPYIFIDPRYRNIKVKEDDIPYTSDMEDLSRVIIGTNGQYELFHNFPTMYYDSDKKYKWKFNGIKTNLEVIGVKGDTGVSGKILSATRTENKDSNKKYELKSIQGKRLFDDFGVKDPQFESWVLEYQGMPVIVVPSNEYNYEMEGTGSVLWFSTVEYVGGKLVAHCDTDNILHIGTNVKSLWGTMMSLSVDKPEPKGLPSDTYPIARGYLLPFHQKEGWNYGSYYTYAYGKRMVMDVVSDARDISKASVMAPAIPKSNRGLGFKDIGRPVGYELEMIPMVHLHKMEVKPGEYTGNFGSPIQLQVGGRTSTIPPTLVNIHQGTVETDGLSINEKTVIDDTGILTHEIRSKNGYWYGDTHNNGGILFGDGLKGDNDIPIVIDYGVSYEDDKRFINFKRKWMSISNGKKVFTDSKINETSTLVLYGDFGTNSINKSGIVYFKGLWDQSEDSQVLSMDKTQPGHNGGNIQYIIKDGVCNLSISIKLDQEFTIPNHVPRWDINPGGGVVGDHWEHDGNGMRWNSNHQFTYGIISPTQASQGPNDRILINTYFEKKSHGWIASTGYYVYYNISKGYTFGNWNYFGYPDNFYKDAGYVGGINNYKRNRDLAVHNLINSNDKYLYRNAFNEVITYNATKNRRKCTGVNKLLEKIGIPLPQEPIFATMNSIISAGRYDNPWSRHYMHPGVSFELSKDGLSMDGFSATGWLTDQMGQVRTISFSYPVNNSIKDLYIIIQSNVIFIENGNEYPGTLDASGNIIKYTLPQTTTLDHETHTVFKTKEVTGVDFNFSFKYKYATPTPSIESTKYVYILAKQKLTNKVNKAVANIGNDIKIKESEVGVEFGVNWPFEYSGYVYNGKIYQAVLLNEYASPAPPTDNKLYDFDISLSNANKPLQIQFKTELNNPHNLYKVYIDYMLEIKGQVVDNKISQPVGLYGDNKEVSWVEAIDENQSIITLDDGSKVRDGVLKTSKLTPTIEHRYWKALYNQIKPNFLFSEIQIQINQIKSQPEYSTDDELKNQVVQLEEKIKNNKPLAVKLIFEEGEIFLNKYDETQSIFTGTLYYNAPRLEVTGDETNGYQCSWGDFIQVVQPVKLTWNGLLLV